VNTGTIYVLCPENNRPSGGIKILYRHVDVLQKSGFSAAILHQQPGFRCTWFTNDTRVVYLPEIQLTERDFLVIPEIFGPKMYSLSQLPQIGPRVKKVIFNQNCYYSFLGHSIDSVLHPEFKTPYEKSDEFVASIVVSEDSKRYLEYTFPGLKVFRIHNAINFELFSYKTEKKKQICFMPRKHTEDALQVLAVLRLRGALEDVSVVPIDNMIEQEVARVMGESLLFLSFGYPEGCPLPPAEAMASGCIVVGYHGQGGHEYFHNEFCYPVAINDIVGFASSVETILDAWKRNPATVQEMAFRASQYVKENYSAELEARDIVDSWRKILARDVRRTI
jgi:glycosyltransferase involved in cell wall biosynthesis